MAPQQLRNPNRQVRCRRLEDRVKTAFGFVLIGLAEIAIFFNTPRHFFTGDTVAWMGYRYRSFAEFLEGFTRIDEAAWYRPLAQKTLGSALFPFAGLNPVPYRFAGFLLFFACTIGVFLFARYVSESPRIAWLATLFFAPHVTHVFVTYDVAFTPELLFTIFFIGSALLYAVYLRNHEGRWLAGSAASFTGALLSKETAVALPWVLVIVWLLLPRKERGSARSFAPHFAILGLYLLFAIGFLHIRDIHFRQLIERPGRAGQPGYELVLGRNMAESIDVASGWVFAIPRATYTEDMIPARWMLAALKVIRAIVCVGAVFVLFTPQRKIMCIGIGWFLMTLLPTLPLLGHFLPYYLFAPLVGFALAAGTVIDWLYTQSSRVMPGLGFASSAVLLTLSAGIQAAAANKMAVSHSVLGESARHNDNAVRDLRALHPVIPRNTVIVVFNEEYPPLSWDLSGDALFQMAYDDLSLKTRYSADGLRSLEGYDRDHLLALKWTNSHLVDWTSFVNQWPDLLSPHAPGEFYQMESGDDGIYIPQLADQAVLVLYAKDGEVQTPLTVKLDGHGKAAFPTGWPQGPGIYTFLAIRREAGIGWVTVSKSITVR